MKLIWIWNSKNYTYVGAGVGAGVGVVCLCIKIILKRFYGIRRVNLLAAAARWRTWLLEKKQSELKIGSDLCWVRLKRCVHYEYMAEPLVYASDNMRMLI